MLGRIFRAFHTTKGVAGFLNFSKLEALTHAAEGLLSRLRDRELIFDSSIASALLNSVDAVRRMLASIESNGTDGEFDYADLIRSLTSLTEGAAQPPDDAVAEGVLAGNQSETVQSLDGAGSAHHADVTAQSVSAPVDQGTTETAPAHTPLAGSDADKAEIQARMAAASSEARQSAPTAAPESPASEERGDGTPHAAESTIRVNVHLLDKVMNLVGELFSSVTNRGAAVTLEALALGANDYVAKPKAANNTSGQIEPVCRELMEKIKAHCKQRKHDPLALAKSVAGQLTRSTAATSPAPVSRHGSQRSEVVVVGVSTGGPNALAEMVPQLPADLPVPMLIAQHMPPIFTRLLAERLAAKSRVPVVEASAGEPLAPGKVWIAPGDYHLTIQECDGMVTIQTDQGPRENSCRPSADVLFRSAAAVFGTRALVVVPDPCKRHRQQSARCGSYRALQAARGQPRGAGAPAGEVFFPRRDGLACQAGDSGHGSILRTQLTAPVAADAENGRGLLAQRAQRLSRKSAAKSAKPSKRLTRATFPP